jgi:hypothetical protein
MGYEGGKGAIFALSLRIWSSELFCWYTDPPALLSGYSQGDLASVTMHPTLEKNLWFKRIKAITEICLLWQPLTVLTPDLCEGWDKLCSLGFVGLALRAGFSYLVTTRIFFWIYTSFFQKWEGDHDFTHNDTTSCSGDILGHLELGEANLKMFCVLAHLMLLPYVGHLKS